MPVVESVNVLLSSSLDQVKAAALTLYFQSSLRKSAWSNFMKPRG